MKITTFPTNAKFKNASKKDLAKFLIDIRKLPISDTAKTSIDEIISSDPKSIDYFTL